MKSKWTRIFTKTKFYKHTKRDGEREPDIHTHSHTHTHTHRARERDLY